MHMHQESVFTFSLQIAVDVDNEFARTGMLRELLHDNASVLIVETIEDIRR